MKSSDWIFKTPMTRPTAKKFPKVEMVSKASQFPLTDALEAKEILYQMIKMDQLLSKSVITGPRALKHSLQSSLEDIIFLSFFNVILQSNIFRPYKAFFVTS